MARGAGLQFSARASEQDINRIRRNLQTRINRIKKNPDKTLKMAAEFGQLVAQSVAPQDTGILVQSIKHRTEEGGRAVVYVDEDVLLSNPSAKWNGKAFNYAYYIHEINSDFPVRITSGEPRFMAFAADATRKFLKEQLRTIL